VEEMIQLDLFEPQYTFVDGSFKYTNISPIGIKFSRNVGNRMIREILSAISDGDITVFDDRGNKLQVKI
jgi:hypothetical protein